MEAWGLALPVKLGTDESRIGSTVLLPICAVCQSSLASPKRLSRSLCGCQHGNSSHPLATTVGKGVDAEGPFN